MIKIFKRNLVQSVSLFILIALINLMVFVGFCIYIAKSSSAENYENRLSFETLEASLSGKGLTPELLERELKKRNNFYLLIGTDGKIVSSIGLPDDLNITYTLADVASFSRWYLKGYPVNTKILDSGELLVYGFPKNSIVKYALTFPTESFLLTLFFFPFLILINFLLFLLIFLNRQQKLQKDLQPLLEGVATVGTNNYIVLDEKGELQKLKKVLNKTNRILNEKEKERTDWIRGISHDIRTPLSVISTTCELLKEDDKVKRIKLNVLKIRNLVESLNFDNKLTYGLIQTQKSSYKFSEILRESVIRFINENNMENYPLTVEIQKELEDFKDNFDYTLFQRMLNNILNNCLVHNGGGSDIKIHLYKKDKIILSISNSLQERSLKTDTPDYGIGLSLVEKIARYHGWSVEILTGKRFDVQIFLS